MWVHFFCGMLREGPPHMTELGKGVVCGILYVCNVGILTHGVLMH